MRHRAWTEEARGRLELFLERAYPFEFGPEQQGEVLRRATHLLNSAMQVVEGRLFGWEGAHRAPAELARSIEAVRAHLTTDLALPLLGWVEAEVLRVEEQNGPLGSHVPVAVPGRV